MGFELKKPNARSEQKRWFGLSSLIFQISFFYLVFKNIFKTFGVDFTSSHLNEGNADSGTHFTFLTTAPRKISSTAFLTPGVRPIPH